jgi:hypothetical protein
MYDKQLIDSHKEKLIKDFEHHVAHFSVSDLYEEGETVSHGIKKLEWRDPTTSIFAINYLITGQTLFVYGDLGEAIYQWSSPIDWEFLSKFSYDYFTSKSRWINGYKKLMDWSSERVEAEMKIFLEDARSDDGEEDSKLLEEVDGWYAYSHSQDEWFSFVSETEVLADQDDAYSWGEAPSFRAVAHLEGIRLAFISHNP